MVNSGPAAAFASAAPFVVAVSGHRDVHPDDLACVAERLFEALQLVAASLPDSALDFLSPLAAGADQLFADQVLRLRAASATPGRIRLLVPLPMPLAAYCIEQGGGDGSAFAARIAPTLQAADKVYEIPDMQLDGTPAAADAPYVKLARYLAIHAHLVIAVWDGRQAPAAPGGTADLVATLVRGVERARHARSAARLAQPEFGHVLHIYTRRARTEQDDAALERPLRALASQGKGGSQQDGREYSPVDCIRAAGAELDALNRRHRAALAAGAEVYGARLALARDGFLATLGTSAHACDGALAALASSFAVADVQAEIAKRGWRRCWIAIALGAVLAASSSLLRLFDDAYGALIETLSFGAGASVAIGAYLWVARSGQRNAYLAYRALAEGLRVQMAWLAAGSAALVSDHYLIKGSEDAAWVREAIDGLALEPVNPARALSPAAVARGWIDAQLAYLDGPNIARRRRQLANSTAWGRRLLVGGLACAVAGVVMIVVAGMKNALVLVLMLVGMKLLTDLGAAWLSFNGKMAHAATGRQAAHLRAVYRRADRALHAIAGDDDAAADLLAALGKEVLDENANWLQLHLERRISWHG